MIPNILVTLLLVTGPYSLSIGELKDQVISKSQAHYAAAGFRLAPTKTIYKIRDRYAQLSTISESRRKFNLYRSFVRRVGYGSKNRVHAVLPPMLEPNGLRYIGGYGEEGCNSGGFSLSNGQGVRSNGGEGYTMSAIAISHEVGHTLGLSHIDSFPNIMHSAALQFAGQPIGFTQRSVRDMKRCLNKK